MLLYDVLLLKFSLKNLFRRHKKFHWYYFSFMSNEGDGRLVITGVASSYLSKRINNARIEDNKRTAGLEGCENVALISCIYIGFMSDEEFIGK